MVSSALLPMALMPNVMNFTGMWFQDLLSQNSQIAELTYVMVMTLTTIAILAMNDLIKWSYKWTYERYLKYQ